MRATRAPRVCAAVGLAAALACAPATKPANDAPPATPPAQPVVAPAPTPAVAPAPARECRNGERLDSGCACRSGGACFDLCCGPEAACAHPAEPGGPSACIFRTPEPSPPAKPAKPCTDGQFLSDGCECEGKTCMDICCVGSTCTHHASEHGGHAKCVSRR